MNAINSNLISGSNNIYTSADKHIESKDSIENYNIEETAEDAATLSISKEGMRRASELTASDDSDTVSKDDELTSGQVQEYRNVAMELAIQSKDMDITPVQRAQIQDNLNKVHLQLSEGADEYIEPSNFTVVI